MATTAPPPPVTGSAPPPPPPPAPPPAPPERRWWERIDTGMALQAVGSAAATAGVIYVIGGVVMWLRFEKAGLPPDQGVALMSRQQLLVIGLRLMILPAIATGALAWLLVRSGARIRSQVARPLRIFADVVAGLVVLGVVLLLPWSWASLTWLAAAVMVVGYQRYEARSGPGGPLPAPPPRPARNRPAAIAGMARWRLAPMRARVAHHVPWQRRAPAGRRARPIVLALLVVAAAALITLGRQLDQPVQLLTATATIKGQKALIEGKYVGADGSDVFLGADRRIVVVPRSTIRQLTIGPPEDRPPSPSILSRVLGANDYAITPFRWWCNGDHYSWAQLGRLCRTQPQIVDLSAGLDGDRFVQVKVRCPEAATTDCHGVVTLESLRRYRFGEFGIPRPLRFHTTLAEPAHMGSADAVIPRGQTVAVCVPIDPGQRGLMRNAAPVGHDKPDRTVFFRLTITKDNDQDVVRRTTFALTVPAPGDAFPPPADCTKAAA